MTSEHQLMLAHMLAAELSIAEIRIHVRDILDALSGANLHLVESSVEVAGAYLQMVEDPNATDDDLEAIIRQGFARVEKVA